MAEGKPQLHIAKDLVASVSFTSDGVQAWGRGGGGGRETPPPPPPPPDSHNLSQQTFAHCLQPIFSVPSLSIQFFFLST